MSRINQTNKRKERQNSFPSTSHEDGSRPKISKINQRLDNAMHMLTLFAQESEEEKQNSGRIREKKTSNQQSRNFRKENRTKCVDTSIVVRKEVINAFVTAVNELVQRNSESIK
ncbi:MAG: hypothetical protein ACOWW1_00060 [archaeon]